MANYTIIGDQLTAATASVLSLTDTAASPTRRAKLFEIVIGSAATPSDDATQFNVGRFTLPGTNSAVTPVALDPADGVATYEGGSNHTVEPTYTAAEELLALSVHQRATVRWVAAPGFELICPATQNNGIGLESVATTTGYLMEATFIFEE